MCDFKIISKISEKQLREIVDRVRRLKEKEEEDGEDR
jgi:hypothetical protein